MPPAMRAVPLSSTVSPIGYDPATSMLYVTFKKGGTYVYHGVDEATADSVIGAPSVGSALHSTIKGNYNFTRA